MSTPGNQQQTPKQQLAELVKRSNRILLLTHEHQDGDALGSVLALRAALQALGKEVVVSLSGKIPAYISFLPGYQDVVDNAQPTLSKEVLISIDESQASVANVAVKRVGERKLILVITPENGTLTTQNVRIEEGTYQLDLIISLDSSSLERTGSLAEQQPDLFYEVPVVNIDHHIDNTHFGTVNLVDVTASSVCEMLVSLIETIGKEQPGLITPDIATCLLTGIITDTNSFQNHNTTPKTLTTAAQLVAAGARQQEIIGEIYRARPLSTLRLWGRALAYLKEDAAVKLAWTSLSKADFVASQATSDEIGGIVDELLKTAAGMRCVLLLSERDGDLKGSLRSLDSSLNVQVIAERLGGGGHPMAAAFKIPNASLKQEHEIIAAIRGMLLGEELPRFTVTDTNTTPTGESSDEPVVATEATEVTTPTTPAVITPAASTSEKEEASEEQPSATGATMHATTFTVKPIVPRPPRPVAKPDRTV
jgi:phosphoesterase RecJ-like protein